MRKINRSTTGVTTAFSVWITDTISSSIVRGSEWPSGIARMTAGVLPKVFLEISSACLSGWFRTTGVKIFRLITSDKTNREIADELHISEKTVANHVSNIFVKTKVGNRTEDAGYANRQSLVGDKKKEMDKIRR